MHTHWYELTCGVAHERKERARHTPRELGKLRKGSLVLLVPDDRRQRHGVHAHLVGEHLDQFADNVSWREQKALKRKNGGEMRRSAREPHTQHKQEKTQKRGG